MLEKNIANLDSLINNNKLLLKSQQRFRCERYNVYTEEVNKIALRH